MNYKILVVDDREENRAAAKSYFGTRSDVEVDYATDYEEAISNLEKELYAGAILDVNFPRKQGCEPEKLGFELGKELNTKYRIPHVFLTAGQTEHHGKWGSVLLGEEASVRSTKDKVYPQAWQTAYETLLELNPDIPVILAARKRLRELTQGG